MRISKYKKKKLTTITVPQIMDGRGREYVVHTTSEQYLKAIPCDACSPTRRKHDRTVCIMFYAVVSWNTKARSVAT